MLFIYPRRLLPLAQDLRLTACTNLRHATGKTKSQREQNLFRTGTGVFRETKENFVKFHPRNFRLLRPISLAALRSSSPSLQAALGILALIKILFLKWRQFSWQLLHQTKFHLCCEFLSYAIFVATKRGGTLIVPRLARLYELVLAIKVAIVVAQWE